MLFKMFVLFGSKDERLRVAARLKDKALKTKEQVKILGGLTDSDLTVIHVKAITKISILSA